MSLDNPLRGLAIFIQFPVTLRAGVRRVENGMLEKRVRHVEILRYGILQFRTLFG
jgi:hypothetical protein